MSEPAGEIRDRDATVPGWRVCLTGGDEDAEDVDEVAVFCPARAAREFDRT